MAAHGSAGGRPPDVHRRLRKRCTVLMAWCPPLRRRYFLRKLRKVKKANGQILACNEVRTRRRQGLEGGRAEGGVLH